MSFSPTKSVAVLGAGITGLTAAYRLARLGHRVRIFERAERVGGAIRTERTGGWLVESGPNSLLAGDAVVRTLFEELHLAGDVVAANPAAKNRYLVRGGKLVAAPLSPPALLASPLFSLGAKIRILAEMRPWPRARTPDLSVAEFVRARFGQEVVDYALNPFVSGVYAGDPEKLSARYAFPRLWDAAQQHGSILRGQRAQARARHARGDPRPSLVSFRRGLQTLTDALGASLPAESLVLRAQIEALVPETAGAGRPPGPPWRVVWSEGATTQTETFDAVVAALPASALAQLRFGPLGERPLASLESIEHPPLSSLFLGYRRERVRHPLDGFGLLAPEVERRPVLGVIFSSTLFPDRAPEGCVALTAMVGGARQPELARLPTDPLLATVASDLRDLLGVEGAPVFQRHAFWPQSIPQYSVGYGVHLETIAATERAHRGLHIGGQARDGISVPACIAAGERLAAEAGIR